MFKTVILDPIRNKTLIEFVENAMKNGETANVEIIADVLTLTGLPGNNIRFEPPVKFSKRPDGKWAMNGRCEDAALLSISDSIHEKFARIKKMLTKEDISSAKMLTKEDISSALELGAEAVSEVREHFDEFKASVNMPASMIWGPMYDAEIQKLIDKSS